MEMVKSSTNSSINYGLTMLDVAKKCQQANSGTYAACEQMIQMSFIVMKRGTLDQILERFEKNGRLTPREHQGLLKFARQLWNEDS
jgi:hypothetical protein